MTDHDTSNLILPPGTQVVALTETRGTDGKVVHPRRAAGALIPPPSVSWPSSRAPSPDSCEATFARQELAILSHYKAGDMSSGHAPLAEYNLYDHVIYRCVTGSRAYGLDT